MKDHGTIWCIAKDSNNNIEITGQQRDMFDEQKTAVRLDEDRKRGETRLWNVRIPVPLGTRLGHEN